MKTEEFDDAIKRKLESINPTFSEKDIERVHKYTVANRSPFSFLGSSRAFWTLMTTGMLVTGLVTWKLTSMFVHAPAPTIIVKAQPATVVEQKTNFEKPVVKPITKTDTIYVNKYIQKDHNTYIQSQASSNKKDLKTPKQYAELPHSKNNLATGQLPTNEVIADKKQLPINTKEQKSNSKPASPEAEKQANNAGNATEKQEPTTIANPNNIPAIKNNDPGANTEKNEPAKKEISKKTPIHNYADEHKLPANENALNLNFMIGAGAEATLANSQSGMGIFTKLLFNNKFSINAGLKLMNVNHQYYATDDDYQDAHDGISLDYIYAQNLIWRGAQQPKLYEVSDINFRYTLWEVPITFEYYFPITHAFSISASVGTDIDVSCTDKLTYDYAEVYHSGYTGSTTSVSKNNNYAAVPINNTVGTLGFIYQIHHFDIQLSPYISKQNVNVWYRGETEWYEGANLKVFYCF